MALTGLTWKKAGPRQHVFTVTDDAFGTREFRVVVPPVLPDESPTTSDYLYAEVKSKILTFRAKAAKRAAREAQENEWEGASEEQQAKVDAALLQLQSELN